MSTKPKPPVRGDVLTIIARYINPETQWNPKAEVVAFYSLWWTYPSREFWTRHELDFHLNSFHWFRTPDGASRLANDWAVFHLSSMAMPSSPDLPANSGTKDSVQSGLDKEGEPVHNVVKSGKVKSKPPVVQSPSYHPTSIAAFLSTSHEDS